MGGQLSTGLSFPNYVPETSALDTPTSAHTSLGAHICDDLTLNNSENSSLARVNPRWL